MCCFLHQNRKWWWLFYYTHNNTHNNTYIDIVIYYILNLGQIIAKTDYLAERSAGIMW